MSISDNIALVHRLNEIRLAYFKSKERLIASYPTWNQNKDVRITVFNKCVNVFHSTNLGMDFIMLDLTDNNWWQSKSPQKISTEIIRHSIREFDIFLKVSFFHLFFSALESSFRIIVRTLDPKACNEGKDNFKKIYTWLLDRLKLQKWSDLLDLLRLIRNTIHNNGIYFPNNDKDEIIEYNGSTYSFIVGAKIGFTWHQLLDFISNSKQMILEVIESPEVVSFNQIDDPFA